MIMAKYKVIANFRDLQDDGFYYKAGDAFPRSGKKATKKRITELATDANRRKMPLIEEVKEEEEDEV